MKIFKAVFLIILSVSGLFAQTPENHRLIRQALAARNYQTALGALRDLEKANKTTFELNNYDYLAARLAEKTGDFAAAAAGYQRVANRNSVLKEYALWHLAQIARESGNLLLERTFLQELSMLYPESLFADAVQMRITRSYFEGKNFESALQLLNAQQTFLSAQKNAAAVQTSTPIEKMPKYRENLVLLGEAYLQTGKTAEARDAFNKLLNNLPNPAQPDDFALAGAKGLDRLDNGDNFGKAVIVLPDLIHLQRALIYQFNRDFADARLHYQAIIQNYPASGNVPDAMYQIGRSFAQTGEYLEAINWFERVQEQFPDHPVSKDALSQAASAYSRVGKPKESVTRYQKFIEKYADADNLERGYLNIVDVLRDAGEDSDALKWTAKTMEAFRGKLPEALALFAQARIHIAKNDWTNALNDLNRLLTFADLGGTRVPGGTNKAEVTFLKGLALEQMQRYPEAIEIYLSIPDGRNEYYGWRATERLRLLANTPGAELIIKQKIAELSKDIETAGGETQRKNAQTVLRLSIFPETNTRMLEILKRTYAALPDYQKIPNFKLLELGRKDILKEKSPVSAAYHQALADELLFLGLYDEGTPELEKADGEKGKKNEGEKNTSATANKDFSYTLAVYYKRGEMANRAVAFIEPLWRNIPADYQIELIPREQAELLYPAPYADALLRYAPERDVDARFVLSIMRQESRYRADVKSAAAARGLMQFISTTSNQIGRELGRDNFRQDDLYNPPTAILFGSHYLQNLFKMFPNQPAAVAASYNGGEDNVKRWLLRSKSNEPDRYVPEIVFSQSKDYAYKVMANYRVYQMFYNENLKAR